MRIVPVQSSLQKAKLFVYSQCSRNQGYNNNNKKRQHLKGYRQLFKSKII